MIKELKNEYLIKRKIDLNEITCDLKLIKKLVKKIKFVNYPCRFQLFKNLNSGRLYLTATTIDFNLVILNYSDKRTITEQFIELFPDYNFLEENCSGGFNLFPGMTNTIYGFSDENFIYPESTILEFENE
jgi:hypothetical protein